MKLKQMMIGGLLALTLSGAAWALDLNGAMGALGAAKSSGLVGEQPNGYLGVVKNSGDAAEIARLINAARKAEYQRLAKQNSIQLSDVESMAGKKALEKTPAGQYIQVNGRWMIK
ncbi:YdbL family protein [Thiopseudomonas alkaliphila]|uniref:YdbL family protein n=1 Tax=Thiopseudomonas alkaliphila TaxID=1697053 RepID=UPI002579232E|nr:YdbL family protein [Thiopseudomonas alkaliphila]MDM1707263.1 YdbL family protein [Thiopseudomonas alkaliphila]